MAAKWDDVHIDFGIWANLIFWSVRTCTLLFSFLSVLPKAPFHSLVLQPALFQSPPWVQCLLIADEWCRASFWPWGSSSPRHSFWPWGSSSLRHLPPCPSHLYSYDMTSLNSPLHSVPKAMHFEQFECSVKLSTWKVTTMFLGSLKWGFKVMKIYGIHVWIPSILPMKLKISTTSCVGHLGHSVPIPLSGVWGLLVEIWGLSSVRFWFLQCRSAEEFLNQFRKITLILNQ